MWVRLDPPPGRELKRAEAPALFETIDDLRRRLKAPRFHHVLVTNDFNAGVVQVPRLGMLGWYSNYLMIGLPLLKSLTVQQFRAVLAHEFGHLSAGDGRVGNWIYRLRMSWGRLMGVLEYQKSWGTFMFRRFFNWYVPYFSAYSFPLARANEYQADGFAVKMTSPRTAAEALTSVSVVGAYLHERYWPDVHKRADDTPQPAFAPYARMGDHFRSGLGEEAARSWLKQALELKTDVSNTHPSLCDRLMAMGQAPHLALPGPGESADKLLGAALPAIANDLDEEWRRGIQAAWERRHQEVREGRARLAALDRQAAQGEPSPADAYERARLTEAYGAGADAALDQFRALHARAPDNPGYCFALGVRLLQRDDASGFKLVEQAMAADEDAIAPGCGALRDYCWRAGRKDEAQAWHDRHAERVQLLQAARAERDTVYLTDKFDRHGLPDDAIAALKGRLKAIPHLQKVYLVRKQVQHFPQRPCYVLGFAIASLFRRHSKKRAEEATGPILDAVQAISDVIVISVEGEYYRFGRKLRWMRGSRIL
jgi:Zn-dependent protease with chaperone function